jgi:hypothetical protein
MDKKSFFIPPSSFPSLLKITQFFYCSVLRTRFVLVEECHRKPATTRLREEVSHRSSSVFSIIADGSIPHLIERPAFTFTLALAAR